MDRLPQKIVVEHRDQLLPAELVCVRPDGVALYDTNIYEHKPIEQNAASDVDHPDAHRTPANQDERTGR